MDTVTKRLYEAMFLVDTAQASSDWDGTLKAIETVLERANADVLSIRKWDERKLAYPVQGKERGTYFLCFFKAPTDSITGLERDVQLSETIMRVLVLRGDHLTAEMMQEETPAMVAERMEKEEGVKEAVENEDEQDFEDEDYSSDSESED